MKVPKTMFQLFTPLMYFKLSSFKYFFCLFFLQSYFAENPFKTNFKHMYSSLFMLAFSDLVYEPGVAELDALTSMAMITELPFLVNLQKF